LLITANGDAELWLRLCSIANPPPVRAVRGSKVGGNNSIAVFQDNRNRPFSTDLFSPSVYGANPVGNDQGITDSGGIAATPPGQLPANLRPYCFRKSGAGDPGEAPICPTQIDNGDPNAYSTGANPVESLDTNYKPQCAPNGCWGPVEADQWATRGAINAAFGVFLYLDRIERGIIQRLPDYDQCEKLQ
jgi:hypothetical protein